MMIVVTIPQVYVLKRPHVDEFLRRVGELYECVLFTASLAKYADPVCDLLDKWEIFRAWLFREHCVFHRGNYVKAGARRDGQKKIRERKILLGAFLAGNQL